MLIASKSHQIIELWFGFGIRIRVMVSVSVMVRIRIRVWVRVKVSVMVRTALIQVIDSLKLAVDQKTVCSGSLYRFTKGIRCYRSLCSSG